MSPAGPTPTRDLAHCPHCTVLHTGPTPQGAAAPYPTLHAGPTPTRDYSTKSLRRRASSRMPCVRVSTLRVPPAEPLANNPGAMNDSVPHFKPVALDLTADR